MATENRPVIVRDPHPDKPWQFKPGNSANPGGRPKGLATLIKAETGDGAELVAFMLDVLRGRKKAPLRLRMEAAAWLADRAFGKATIPLELSGADGGPIDITLALGTPPGPADDDGDG